MDIEKLTIGEARDLASLFSVKQPDESHWVVGKSYFIRTVTHHFTGRLVKVMPTELVLTDAAWIADDGRFSGAVAKGTFSEVEPFPDGAEVILNRMALIDAVQFTPALPRSQK